MRNETSDTVGVLEISQNTVEKEKNLNDGYVGKIKKKKSKNATIVNTEHPLKHFTSILPT